eukprot:CAMPEP_0201562484 /NCGR_PEP_ID=MMETSP0173_2-20130828/79357_1 /ASSEMBLY_ACC=CAM_ASM_000268 /TAXON_ID=218659 /ORGANISM="Vexillifera sp., Strain DIVA3 564/2" /LENGTH=286 /DNA_ID=CAMNT_0047977057 /DNA_START=738 /DNA_END=1598 /DNA_ORIENTATION=-
MQSIFLQQSWQSLSRQGRNFSCTPWLQDSRSSVEEKTTTSTPKKKFKEEPYHFPHPIWNKSDLNIELTHRKPESFVDHAALATIKTIRFNFDWMTGYSFGRLTPRKLLTRCIFLESIAGVPGFIGGALRHLKELREMNRDNNFIHTLLEEASNEAQHLLSFVTLKQPGMIFRFMVMLSQGVFWNFFFVAYLISPHFCHRLVGYLEEEAVNTYTHALQEIEHNPAFAQWKEQPAPQTAIDYWKMDQNATVFDLFKQVRADEAHHRDVNHRFADMDMEHETNPYGPGE